MAHLRPLDLLVVGAYFALVVTTGMLMSRRAAQGMESYFLAGRSLSWVLLGISGMALWFDLTGTMLITSFLYLLGPQGLFIEFRGGAVLVLAFMLAFTGKWHRRSQCLTAAQWYTFRFGEGRAAELVRFLTALMGIILAIGMLAYLVRGASLFLGMFSPFSPIATTAVVIAIATVYTMFAGYYGVVVTNLIHGTVLIVACIVVALIAWHSIAGAGSLAHTAKLVTGNSQWTNSTPSWQVHTPPGYGPYHYLIFIVAFYLLRNVIGGMGSGAEQRYFAAKSDRDCGLLSLLQAATLMFRWPMMIGYAILGIFLVHHLYPDTASVHSAAMLIHHYYPRTAPAFWQDLLGRISHDPQRYAPGLTGGLRNILGNQWRARLPLVGYAGGIDPELILPAVLQSIMAPAIRDLLLIAMLATMMTSLTGQVNTATALLVNDIYKNFLRRTAGNRELIVTSYVGTLIIVGIGFVMGIEAESINNLWGWIIMGLTAGTLGPMVLRLYWWRCNAWGVAAGTFGGGLAAISQRVLEPNMLEWKQFILMTGISFSVTIAASLLTRPTPAAVTEHFYRVTRPFGLWGPLRTIFSADQRKALAVEHRNDILTVPFALLWQVTLFLLPMQLVMKAYQSFCLTLPLFLLGVVGMYIFWWRQLPKTHVSNPLFPVIPLEANAKAKQDSTPLRASGRGDD
jgi:Na+/proline symporter